MQGGKGYLNLTSKYSDSEVRGLTDADVLEQEVSWETLRAGNILSYDHCDAILQYDKAPSADQSALLKDDNEAERLAAAFSSLLHGTSRRDVLQYVLVLVYRMLEEHPERAVLFLKRSPDPIDSLLKMLNRTKEEFTVGKAAAVISQLISTGKVPAEHMERFNTWIIRKLPDSKGDALVAALFALKNALKDPGYQKYFVDASGVSLHLNQVIRNNSNHRQVLYLTGFCLWLLSFQNQWKNTSVLIKAQLMQSLVHTLNDRLKPKIVRIILCLFENMLDSETFRQLMVMKGLVGILESLQADKWEDGDIMPLIKKLQNGLEGDVKALSSYERYIQELKSGQLQPGPVHTAPFWKANAHKFEVDEFALIKSLIKLLSVFDDNETVALTCYDLGEWARFYPDGRKIVETLGGKDRIMVLLSHEDEEVQKQALLAIQKLLVQNWKSIEGNDEEKR